MDRHHRVCYRLLCYVAGIVTSRKTLSTQVGAARLRFRIVEATVMFPNVVLELCDELLDSTPITART